MIVKIKRVDGVTEFFETNSYACAKPEETHPAILEYTVRDNNGRKLKKWRRPHQREYIRNYKPEAQELQPETKE